MPVTKIILMLLVPVAACWSLTSIVMFFIFRPYKMTLMAGVKFHGFLPANRGKIGREIASYIARSAESAGRLKLFDSTSVINALRPEIEEHVDYFLKEKLKEAFPLMHQVMGEKTLEKFRVVFLEEVESILPVLLQKQSSEILSKFELEKMVVAKISKIAEADIEASVLRAAGNYPERLKIIAAGTGLIIGLLQIVIEYVYY